jgi:hypothetical protein
MLAVGADVERFLDDLLEEHVPALGAAHPEAFGNAVFFLAGWIGWGLRHKTANRRQSEAAMQ